MPASLPVFRYRIRNWREYNRALINRGRLTVWFDEQTVVAWHNTEPAAGPGAPWTYSDLAIECVLVFKSVYRRSLRGAQGSLSSVMELMRLTRFCQISRQLGISEMEDKMQQCRGGGRWTAHTATHRTPRNVLT